MDKYGSVAKRIDGDGMVFVVPSGNLGCSIIVFCATCITSLSLLVFRRRVMGLELGGPAREKYTVAGVFVAYWIGYIIVVCWWALRINEASRVEVAAVLSTAAVVMVSLWAVTMAVLIQRKRRSADTVTREAAGGSNSATPDAAEGVANISITPGAPFQEHLPGVPSEAQPGVLSS